MSRRNARRKKNQTKTHRKKDWPVHFINPADEKQKSCWVYTFYRKKGAGVLLGRETAACSVWSIDFFLKLLWSQNKRKQWGSLNRLRNHILKLIPSLTPSDVRPAEERLSRSQSSHSFLSHHFAPAAFRCSTFRMCGTNKDLLHYDANRVYVGHTCWMECSSTPAPLNHAGTKQTWKKPWSRWHKT